MDNKNYIQKKIKNINELYTLIKKNKKQPNSIEIKNYYAILEQLKNMEWHYTLGKENELDTMPEWYDTQKRDILDRLEDDLINKKADMARFEQHPKQDWPLLERYYDIYSEIVWINGGIYMIDIIFASLSDNDMPKAHMKHWVHTPRNNIFGEMIKKLYEAQKNYNEDSDKNKKISKSRYEEQVKKLLDKGWDYAFGHDMELPKEDMPERYLKHKANVVKGIENDMNTLAKQYPLVKDNDAESHKVILSYYDKFIELLCINGGIEGLNLKETLPLEKMPKVYRYNQEINHALSQSRGR